MAVKVPGVQGFELMAAIVSVERAAFAVQESGVNHVVDDQHKVHVLLLGFHAVETGILGVEHVVVKGLNAAEAEIQAVGDDNGFQPPLGVSQLLLAAVSGMGGVDNQDDIRPVHACALWQVRQRRVSPSRRRQKR